MKKHLTYIVLLLCVTATATAQPRLREPEMYVGVHGGVMASTIQFKPANPNMTPFIQSVFLTGNGGLVFRYSGHKCCAIQVELNYLQRGWKEHSEAGNYIRRLDYIELPFLTHIYFGSPTWRGFVNLGPEIGYCVHDDGGKGVKQTYETHQYAAIDKRFDWGVTGGLGFYCRTKNAGLYQLEARFAYSLGTIFAARSSDYFGNANSMNLSINLAWMWEIHPKHKQPNQTLQ